MNHVIIPKCLNLPSCAANEGRKSNLLSLPPHVSDRGARISAYYPRERQKTEIIMNMKKLTGLVLFGITLTLLPSVLHAAATGAVSAKITLEFEGKSFPMNQIQITILDKEIDLRVVDFRAKQNAKKNKNKKRSYHLYRYTYLVRAIENSRRVGVRQIRSGIVTKRADSNGEVLVRYLVPGDYFIGAYRKIDKRAVVWFVPFSVTAGRSTQINLDNNNAFEFYDPDLYP